MELEYYSSFVLDAFSPKIVVICKTTNSLDLWTRETCLDGYFVSSDPQRLYSPLWGCIRCFTAWPSNRSNLTFGSLPKIVWITAPLSTQPFLNAEMCVFPGTPLLPRAVLNNKELRTSHLVRSSGAGFHLHCCPLHHPSAAFLGRTELGTRTSGWNLNLRWLKYSWI